MLRAKNFCPVTTPEVVLTVKDDTTPAEAAAAAEPAAPMVMFAVDPRVP